MTSALLRKAPLRVCYPFNQIPFHAQWRLHNLTGTCRCDAAEQSGCQQCSRVRTTTSEAQYQNEARTKVTRQSQLSPAQHGTVTELWAPAPLGVGAWKEEGSGRASR